MKKVFLWEVTLDENNNS